VSEGREEGREEGKTVSLSSSSGLTHPIGRVSFLPSSLRDPVCEVSDKMREIRFM